MKRLWQPLIFILYGTLFGWLVFRENLLFWGLGFVSAGLLTLIDRALYVWWLKPYEQLSIQIQYWWKKKDVIGVAKLLTERGNEQTKLVFRSAGFALVWPFLSIYLMTSSGSILALGMILGLGFLLVSAIVADWNDWRLLKRWFWWQIKRDVSERELRVIAGFFVAIWFFISLVVMAR